jgi:ribonucleoside-diphosphate reductase alpha chain
MVNNTAPLALKTLGYTDEEIAGIVAHVQEKGTLHEAPHLVDAHLPVFDCAFPTPGSERCIPWNAHVKMMAAAQPFISGAISKTVNMPNSATVQDIADAYMLAWELGLKAVAVYRDGSKGMQPLNTSEDGAKTKEGEAGLSRKEKRKLAGPRRERLPDTRQSVTHKFNISGHEGYITVGLYPDGRVGELFITMAKEGSTIGGLMDCFGTSISMSLQYGVPLSVYVEKFSHTRFEPLGHTKNPDIPLAKSLVDYIFRWLGRTFLPDMQSVQQDPQNRDLNQGDGQERWRGRASVEGKRSMTAKVEEKVKESEPMSVKSISVIDSPAASSMETFLKPETFTLTTSSVTAADDQYEMYRNFQADSPLCDACGAITVRSGNCYLCHNCGKSMGCS